MVKGHIDSTVYSTAVREYGRVSHFFKPKSRLHEIENSDISDVGKLKDYMNC